MDLPISTGRRLTLFLVKAEAMFLFYISVTHCCRLSGHLVAQALTLVADLLWAEFHEQCPVLLLFIRAFNLLLPCYSVLTEHLFDALSI